jgi:enoyl-CoA hydratase
MPVSMTIDGAVATLMIDRPQKRNALDLACFADLTAAIERVMQGDIRVMAVKATASPAFCAGVDIAELQGISVELASERATYRRAVFQSLSELPIPTIAVVDGYALGGGAELAMACTFRLATTRAKFAFPEIDLGYLPGAGGTQRLPRLVGQTRALDLMLTGRALGSDEALRIGLIDRIVKNPDDDAHEFAATLSSRSGPAVSAIIASVRSSELPLRDGLAEEGRFLALLNKSPEAAARVSAFLNKTK